MPRVVFFQVGNQRASCALKLVTLPGSETFVMKLPCNPAGRRQRPEAFSGKQVPGFTLVELLVVMVIVLIVVGLALPAVQAIREASRTVTCNNNLRQLGLAGHSFESAHRAFPRSSPNHKLSILAHLLPYIEQESLFAGLDVTRTSWDVPNNGFRRVVVPAFLCPSDTAGLEPATFAPTNYVGNSGIGYQAAGFNGVFGPGLYGIRFSDIEDGASNTSMISESLVAGHDHYLRWIFRSPRFAGPGQLEAFAEYCRGNRYYAPDVDRESRCHCWMDPSNNVSHYNHVIEPGYPSCTNDGSVTAGCFPANSFHPGGVNAVFVDGHVEFVAASIDIRVWRSMGSRNSIDQ